MENYTRGFSSNIGAILAAAGGAVGLGNIWRFPYMLGQNGGGAFLLVYVFFVILIGVKGEGTLTIDGEDVSFRAGESILLPAYIKEVRVNGTLKFLETYVLSE